MKIMWKWRDIQPGMGTHTRNSCSAFTHPKCTHTAVNTHPEQCAAIYAAAPGEQLGVRCLAQGHLSRGIEGGESAVHLDYESDSLTIRPWVDFPKKYQDCLIWFSYQIRYQWTTADSQDCWEEYLCPPAQVCHHLLTFMLFQNQKTSIIFRTQIKIYIYIYILSSFLLIH